MLGVTFTPEINPRSRQLATCEGSLHSARVATGKTAFRREHFADIRQMIDGVNNRLAGAT
jgi:hypothetical protein